MADNNIPDMENDAEGGEQQGGINSETNPLGGGEFNGEGKEIPLNEGEVEESGEVPKVAAGGKAKNFVILGIILLFGFFKRKFLF